MWKELQDTILNEEASSVRWVQCDHICVKQEAYAF